MRKVPTIAFAFLCGGSLWVAGGCVTENKFHKPPAQPEWVQPQNLSLFATFPEDTDGNGYYDTLTATVYLFDQRFPAPVRVPGAFEFTLLNRDGKPIATWKRDAAQTSAAERAMPAGPGYFFTLDLRDAGIEKLPSQVVDLGATFMPQNGRAVQVVGGASLRIGRSAADRN